MLQQTIKLGTRRSTSALKMFPFQNTVYPSVCSNLCPRFGSNIDLLFIRIRLSKHFLKKISRSTTHCEDICLINTASPFGTCALLLRTTLIIFAPDDLFFTLLGFLCSFYITPHYYSLSEKLVAALIVTGERGAETEADSPYHIPRLIFPSTCITVAVKQHKSEF